MFFYFRHNPFTSRMAERPEDLNLPTTVVTKIIKDCLPSTCKVSKEANVAIAKVDKHQPEMVN